jgi:predicted FMN-binding regulatory protein PaiB
MKLINFYFLKKKKIDHNKIIMSTKNNLIIIAGHCYNNPSWYNLKAITSPIVPALAS